MKGNFFVSGFRFMLLTLLPIWCFAQGTPEDYKRAEAYGELIRDKVMNVPAQITWVDKQDKFWYSVQTKEGRRFVLVDANKRSKSPLFDHSRLAQALAKASKEKVEQEQLPFNTLSVTGDGAYVEFAAFQQKWKVDLKTYDITRESQSGSAPGGRGTGYWGDRRDDSKGDPIPSPDSSWYAYIKNNNVYLRPADNAKEEHQLTFDGSPGEYYAAYIAWSPDSRKLAVNKVRPNTPRTLYLMESSPSDQLQPKLQTRHYLKPGDALPQYQPVLVDVLTKKTYPVNPSLIHDQYGLSRLEWRKDSRAFTFEFNKRGHQQYTVFSVDAQTGHVSALIDERSETFVEYSGKKYRRDLNDGHEILWASERDGWNHLYLYDGNTGKVKSQITQGEWVVRRVIHVDEKSRRLIFQGSGREEGQDPYLLQYYSVNFDGSDFRVLTNENAQHAAVFSDDHKYFVDTYSRVDLPPVTVLRQTSDGKVLMELEKADIGSLQDAGWKEAEVFSAKGRDGETDIWGIIVRPTNFDPQKKYPVIEYIYAGPHSSFVPKVFSPNPAGLGALAELGFIVVQIDGMGTSNRSKAFHDVAWKNLKDAGFPDRIAWMKSAAAKYSYMDLDRVGIYGTSAGGQNAGGAVLFHPEFYKVAVASCGCHDNRMDKIWWNEQWMGFPIGSHYAESSNVVNAHRLEGKLMLIVGEMDDNVDPASTYQFVDALIKAGKDHEFIMVPGMGHSSGGQYGEQKRRDFFVKHLLGVNPPVWKGQKSIF